MKSKLQGLTFGCSLALVSCAVDSQDRIGVESNELGVTTIEINRFVENGANVFELVGLSADDAERARIRLTAGSPDEVSGLAEALPYAKEGADLTVTAGDFTSRMLTPHINEVEALPLEDLAAQQFVELATVKTQLAKAHIVFASAAPAAATEGAYAFAAACQPSQLLVTPTAYHCCYGSLNSNDAFNGTPNYTMFINHSNGNKVLRKKSIYGACRTSTGSSSCSGTACYYGPQGFAISATYPPAAAPNNYWNILVTATSVGGTTVSWCEGSSATAEAGSMGNVVGSNARGWGCSNGTPVAPGGNSGADCGAWDY